MHFIPASGLEEVAFYEFYMILNEVVKIYIPWKCKSDPYL